MLNTFSAFSFEIICSPVSIGISVFSPVSLFIILFTILGFIYVPLLAILETAVTICNGVISNLCPKLIVANSTGPAFSSFMNILFASPGNFIPVLLNSPNFLKYS